MTVNKSAEIGMALKDFLIEASTIEFGSIDIKLVFNGGKFVRKVVTKEISMLAGEDKQ